MALKKSVESFENKIIYFVEPFISKSEIEKLDPNLKYSKLLESFVHINVNETEARKLWKHILINAKRLEKKLKRKISPHLAMVDYFIGDDTFLKSPYLVEIKVFQKTEELTMIDPLTNTFNRRYLDLALQKEVNRSERYEKQFSLAIFDIDDFKKINDSYGHVVGDEVLQAFAQHIKSLIREEDILCRFGGEEFLIILPETEMTGAMQLCDRIRTSFKEKILIDKACISFSAGIASYPECGKDSTSLIRQADKALYEAKYSGKDKCVLAHKNYII